MDSDFVQHAIKADWEYFALSVPGADFVGGWGSHLSQRYSFFAVSPGSLLEWKGNVLCAVVIAVVVVATDGCPHAPPATPTIVDHGLSWMASMLTTHLKNVKFSAKKKKKKNAVLKIFER